MVVGADEVLAVLYEVSKTIFALPQRLLLLLSLRHFRFEILHFRFHLTFQGNVPRSEGKKEDRRQGDELEYCFPGKIRIFQRFNGLRWDNGKGADQYGHNHRDDQTRKIEAS
ncbi:hypothetical protein K0B90_07250 [bacterium]|nr:hypothetical protein [bacterium]